MKKILSASLVALALSGCGGGGDSSDGDNSPETSKSESRGFDIAYFIDSLVIGLDYKLLPSGEVKTIGEAGTLLLNKDTTSIVIKIGELELPSVDVREIITPEDIFPANLDAANNVLRLVQSLDTDDSPTTITINDTAVKKVTNSVDIAVPSIEFIEELEAEAPSLFADSNGLIKDEFVTIDEATNHFNETKQRLESDDFDGDGFSNTIDLCPLVPSTTNDLVDTDSDKVADLCDADDDNDNLTDVEEQSLGTDPKNADSDNDGLTDGAEVNTHKSSPTNSDTDGDGLSDGEEVERHSTNPSSADSDGDGLRDDEELQDFNTDPNSADSDGDGFSDKEEIDNGTDPNDERILGVWDQTNWNQSVWQ